jgi:hypothetical protein
MNSRSSLANLLVPQQGKMRQISSQDRQSPRGMFAKVIGPEPGKMVEIAPGETFTLAEIEGRGTITRIWMTTWNMPGSKYNFNHYGLLRFYWDGEDTPSVEVPFGDFFGVPWGKYVHYIAEPSSCTSGGYNCYFPMPFSQGCRIEVVNQAPVPWPELFFQVQYLEQEEQPSPLRFHAQWRRQSPTQYRVPYRVVDAQGEGHLAGMHLFMQNSHRWLNLGRMLRRFKETGNLFGMIFPEMFGMGMLEGWESIYVDGEPTPSIVGTGTEDYFNSGFYFNKGTYSAPHWGCTVRNYLTSRCAAYRFHIVDPIPFKKSITVDIDHGYTNQIQTDYISVAYWYQHEPHAPFPPLPPVAQRLPTPTGHNTLQFALFTSPVWAPAAWLALKMLGKLFGRKKFQDS